MNSAQQDLVFIGGGHSHALVINQLGTKPIPNTRLTLISEKRLTPYSGMLPGFVAGHYDYLDAHIDLANLCQWANVRFICGTVTKIAADSNTVFIDSQENVKYDQLSIDIGSTPDLSVPGAKQFATGVKPVSHFGTLWQQMLEAAENTAPARWGIVGAGAGGVELILAMAHRLQEHKRLTFHLAFSGPQILPGYPKKVVEAAEAALARNNITLHPNFRVAQVQSDGLLSESGAKIDLDKSIWCTGATAANWLKETGLKLSDKGFISVNTYLQSDSHKNVFAAGDCADMHSDPRPKAGVYAVRQAPFLLHNLRAACTDNEFKPVKLQTDFLSLLSLGEKRAVGCRGGFTVSGRWLWKLKNYIDQTFMRKVKKPGVELPKE